MKKAVLLLLTVALLFSVCACVKKSEEVKEPVNFYYCNEDIFYHSPDGVIRSEVREAADFAGQPQALIRAYLSGPVSDDLLSPFPDGTRLISFSVTDGTAYITFSKEITALSGVQLSTACSCITLTLVEFTPITAVHIRADDGLLDNKEEVVLNAGDIVLMDELSQKG